MKADPPAPGDEFPQFHEMIRNAPADPAAPAGIDITQMFDGRSVRILGTPDAPLFVAKDVCLVLGIKNTTQALESLEEDERAMLNIGRQGDANVVTESGLYALIFKSRKAEAKKFRQWVTNVVIPSIRKTGGYGNPAAIVDLNDPATLRGLLVAHIDNEIKLKAKIAEDAPKVEGFIAITEAEGEKCITVVAKILQMPPGKLFTWMNINKWIYRRNGSDEWIPYQIRIEQGMMVAKTHTTTNATTGAKTIRERALVTAKGITKLSIITKTTPQ